MINNFFLKIVPFMR